MICRLLGHRWQFAAVVYRSKERMPQGTVPHHINRTHLYRHCARCGCVEDSGAYKADGKLRWTGWREVIGGVD